jgi:hypothetical protein
MVKNHQNNLQLKLFDALKFSSIDFGFGLFPSITLAKTLLFAGKSF